MSNRVLIVEEPEIVEDPTMNLPSELTPFYEASINRIKDIIGESAPANSTEIMAQAYRVHSSFADYVKWNCICNTENPDDVCSGCAGKSASGVLGHYPWDELEMKKHGWVDDRCQHLGSIPFEDDLSLLHQGLLDKQGNPVSRDKARQMLDTGPLRAASQSRDTIDVMEKVRIGQTVETEITEGSESSEGKGEDSEETEDGVKKEIHWDTFSLANDGEMTIVKTENRRATLFHKIQPPQLIFLERGELSNHLLFAKKH